MVSDLQSTSSFPNVASAAVASMAGQVPLVSNAQLGGGGGSSYPGLETDADLRFRRSKQLFEQAQRTHQQTRNPQQQTQTMPPGYMNQLVST